MNDPTGPPSSSSYSWSNYSSSASLLFGAIEMLCFAVGAPGSIIIFSYFISKSKEKTASTLLYIGISSMDVIISLLCLSPAISHFHLGDAMLFGNALHCHLWGYFWLVCSRMSIMFIAVLSIARTVALSIPFCKVRRRHVVLPTLFYFVLLLVEFSFPFYLGRKRGHYYIPDAGSCSFYTGDVFPEDSVALGIYEKVTLANSILPFPIILLSCCISMYKIRSARKLILETHQRTVERVCHKITGHGNTITHDTATLHDNLQRKRGASITIIILTISYILFNTPICLWKLLEVTGGKGWVLLSCIVGHDYPLYYTVYVFLEVNCAQINSVLNVAVYFVRIQGLQRHARKVRFS